MGGHFFSLPDSQALELGFPGPTVVAAVAVVAVTGWVGARGTRQAVGGGWPHDWASQPCLIALGAGCVGGPYPDRPRAWATLPAGPPASLCHLSKPLFSLLLTVPPAGASACLPASCPVTQPPSPPLWPAASP